MHEQRPPTKKQRKSYHRHLQEKYGKNHQKLQSDGSGRDAPKIPGQHGAPGSRAGPRREYYQAMKDEWAREAAAGSALVTQDDDDDHDDYTLDDALLDDLMGNTKHLSSQPTPRPKYLGDLFQQYRDDILQKMQAYHEQERLLLEQKQNGNDNSSSSSSLPVLLHLLPSDQSIARTIRAFRDKHGTKQKPIGLVRALSFVLQDLQVPLETLDEYSFNALMSCCRTPAEGRRVMKLMLDQQQPVDTHQLHANKITSPYTWSILVDLHAKVGDHEGCAAVMEEMLTHNVTPALPTYTSYLAACYKVCSDGRVSHKVRAKAAQDCWSKWMDMRVVGVDPDVMAYGAMLRICACVGHAERALNILEEMEQLEVKPTTLCFTSALRAVAKSQAIAIRYENGSSKRNRRRELLASHHGKMAARILQRAESAQVEQDDGFVAALIMCAANVGDVATAKAIFVASEIRKLDQFRSIGSNRHLAKLRGEPDVVDDRLLLSEGSDNTDGSRLLHSNNSSSLATYNQSKRLTHEEREYGKDSRVLSAILHACANAVDSNIIGTLWQGRENRGYLCEDSLRLLTAQKVPNYVDNSIPFQSTSDDLTWEGEQDEDEYRGGKRSKRAFKGVEELEGGSLDELDEEFAKIYLNDEGELKEEFRKTTPEDIWRMKYKDEDSQHLLDAVAGREDSRVLLPSGEDDSDPVRKSEMSGTEANVSTPKVDMYFDFETMSWKDRATDSLQVSNVANPLLSSGGSSENRVANDKGSKAAPASSVPHPSHSVNLGGVDSDSSLSLDTHIDASEGEELYFDVDAMRWLHRPVKKKEASDPALTAFESKVLKTDEDEYENVQSQSGIGFDEAEFVKFYDDLRAEIADSGEEFDEVDEEEARELFTLMKEEYNEVMNMDMNELVERGLVGSGDLQRLKSADASSQDDETESESESDGFDKIWEGIESDLKGGSPMDDALSNFTETEPKSDNGSDESETPVSTKSTLLNQALANSSMHQMAELAKLSDMAVYDGAIDESYSLDPLDELEGSELEELRSLFPAFSDRRLSKILTVFKKNLDDPPLLELIPLVREKMPDYVTATWLKQMSSMTARYVVHKAGQDGLVDMHMLNGALELETKSGSLNRALDFFESEYLRHGMVPNEYSNRLLLQMFLSSNRFSRALAFKHQLKEAGTELDIISYGSLVEYCGRHGQAGSAMLLLKECLAVHGAAPGEASLSRLRALCRENGLNDELTAMVGPDPVEWLRHGEAKLKREYSKASRRDTQYARSRLVHL
ncbi:hypothetical protein MPSEU_000360500 [Mayamaea pseudoterrestris]|nr:hypothetical protein MPSEU_000360500 [Mayamaea pseudoterrestris]